MREFAAAGGGGAKRQRPLFLILRSRQPVRQVSRERESLAQRGGGHRGHKAKKKKKKRKRIKSPFQSSQTASDPPSGKGATSLSETRAPLVSHFIFCPVVFVFSFIL